jgi:hypothetical protein
MNNQEESKQAIVSSSKLNGNILPCFSIYDNIDSLSPSDLQIKRDFKWKMVAPHTGFDIIPIEN